MFVVQHISGNPLMLSVPLVIVKYYSSFENKLKWYLVFSFWAEFNQYFIRNIFLKMLSVARFEGIFWMSWISYKITIVKWSHATREKIDYLPTCYVNEILHTWARRKLR